MRVQMLVSWIAVLNVTLAQEAFYIAGSRFQFKSIAPYMLSRNDGKNLIVGNTLYSTFYGQYRAVPIITLDSTLSYNYSMHLETGSLGPSLTVRSFTFSDDSAYIFLSGIHSSIYGSGGFLFVIDTMGSVKAFKGVNGPAGASVPLTGQRWIFSMTRYDYGYHALMVTDTLGACIKAYRTNITPMKDMIAAYHTDSVIAFVGSGGNGGGAGCQAPAWFRIDTQNMTVYAYWLYVDSNRHSFFNYVHQIDDSTFIGCGFVYDSCDYASQRRPLLVKFNSKGDILWSRVYVTSATTTREMFNAVYPWGNGFVAVGSANTWSPNIQQDILVIQTDGDGNLLKAQVLQTEFNEEAHALLFDNNTFLILGRFDTIDPGTGNLTPYPLFLYTDSSFSTQCLGIANLDVTQDFIGIDSSFTVVLDTFLMTNMTCNQINSIGSGGTITQGGELFQFVFNPISIFIDTVVDALCYGDTGYVVANISGGTEPYSIIWNGSYVSSGLPDTFYSPATTVSVYATDGSQCYSDTLVVSINQPDSITIIIDQIQHVLCNGDSNGIISITTSGGTGFHTYQWTTGDSTSMIDSLSAGTYSVTVTDSVGCKKQRVITINEPPLLTVEIDTSGVPVLRGNVSGGTPPYSYQWSDGSLFDSIVLTGSDSVILVVSDANGCSATDSVYIRILSVYGASEARCVVQSLSNSIHIQCPAGVTDVVLLSQDGKIIARSQLESGSKMVTLSAHYKGILLLLYIDITGQRNIFKIHLR